MDTGQSYEFAGCSQKCADGVEITKAQWDRLGLPKRGSGQLHMKE